MLDADSRPSFYELTEEFAKMARDPGRYLVISVSISLKGLLFTTIAGIYIYSVYNIQSFHCFIGGAVMNEKAGKSTWYLCTIFVSGTCRLLHSHSILLDRYGNSRAISKYWGGLKLTYGRKVRINMKKKILYILILLWSDKCNLFFFSHNYSWKHKTLGEHKYHTCIWTFNHKISSCVLLA